MNQSLWNYNAKTTAFANQSLNRSIGRDGVFTKSQYAISCVSFFEENSNRTVCFASWG